MIAILGSAGGVGSALLEHAGSSTPYGVVLGATRQDYDLSSTSSVDAWFGNLNCVDSQVGQPLYVVYCPAVARSGYASRLVDEDIDSALTINLGGAVRVARGFLHAAKSRPGSSILFLGSVVGRTGFAGAALYGATKAGLSGFVRGFAKEIAPFAARANVLELGYFDVGMWNEIPKNIQADILDSIPVGRLGSTEELWNLCSAVLTNPYITGATLPITGGL